MSTPPSPAGKPLPPHLAVILMGVAGSGKTVVGEALSAKLAVPFLDGDHLHPKANVAKMSSGTPLTDEDRWPWLDAIGEAIREHPDGVIVACSALKRIYRERLTQAAGRPITFVLLDGSHATLTERLGRRKGHFMPPSLLASQLATLERPAADERAAIVSIEPSVDEVTADVAAAIAGFR